MPKRTLVRTVTVEGSKGKRFRSATRGTRVPRALSVRDGFPMSKTVKMKYVTTFRLSPSLADNADYFFRANSIFDPNYTGVGHQPYTHDTWASIYNHYKVLGCSIKLQGTPTTNTPVILGCRLSDDVTAEQDIDSLMESNGCKFSVGQDASKLMVVNYRFNSNTTLPESGKDAVSAFGANPSEVTFFHIFGRHLNGLSTGSNMDVVIELTYTVKMWELKDLGKS